MHELTNKRTETTDEAVKQTRLSLAAVLRSSGGAEGLLKASARRGVHFADTVPE